MSDFSWKFCVAISLNNLIPIDEVQACRAYPLIHLSLNFTNREEILTYHPGN